MRYLARILADDFPEFHEGQRVAVVGKLDSSIALVSAIDSACIPIPVSDIEPSRVFVEDLVYSAKITRDIPGAFEMGEEVAVIGELSNGNLLVSAKGVSTDVPPSALVRIGRQSTGASKFDDGKPMLSLLPKVPLELIAKVFEFGAKKYGKNNWRKGLDCDRVISAAMRHITAFNEGEVLDSESGLPHLAHAACNLMFAMQYQHGERKNGEKTSNSEGH